MPDLVIIKENSYFSLGDLSMPNHTPSLQNPSLPFELPFELREPLKGAWTALDRQSDLYKEMVDQACSCCELSLATQKKIIETI